MLVRHALATSAALIGGALIFFEACLPSARFPSCKTNEDCADKEGTKQCFDTRCVECRSDDDCGDGRYCETNSRACKSLGDMGAASHPAPSASAVEATTAP